MTQMIDLEPQASAVKNLLTGITEDQLSARTPCPDYRVKDLLDHFLGLTLAFQDAAKKAPGTTPPAPGEWRDQLAVQLDALATAWRDPSAWEGSTVAGGVELPAHVMGVVALDELLVHGWDLARATGQRYEPDAASVEACFRLLADSAEDSDRGMFGPVVAVDESAPLIDRTIGLSGRDPAWTPAQADA